MAEPFEANCSEVVQKLQSLLMYQAHTCGLVLAPGPTTSAPK